MTDQPTTAPAPTSPTPVPPAPGTTDSVPGAPGASGSVPPAQGASGSGTAPVRAPDSATPTPGAPTPGGGAPGTPTSTTPTPELFSWEFATDPYPAYAWLREHAPVHRTRLPSGVEAWLVTRYADAKQVLADQRLSKNPAHHAEPEHAKGKTGIPGSARRS